MKRTDFYNFVREEIINELSEGEAEDRAADVAAKANQQAQIKAADEASKAADAAKKAADAKKAAVAADKNPGLNEMARIAAKIKIGDPRKLELAQKVYKKSTVAKLIELIKNAGEEGMTQDELAQALGIANSSEINSDINLLVKAGAFAKPKKEEPVTVEPVAKPETTDVTADEDEWEAGAEEKDEWEKPEEEETAPDEPSAAELAKAEREAKKMGGKGYAKELSPEDEEKYNKLKKGIDAKIAKLTKLSKSKRMMSDDLKILNQLVVRDDVKKLFKAKGIDLKDLVKPVYGK